MAAPIAPAEGAPAGHPPRTRTLIVLVIAVMASTAGDLLLKHGMDQVGAIALADLDGLAGSFALAHRVATTPAVVLGVACMALFFALYLATLSWADLSFVLPITALSFVIVTLCPQLLFHEPVSLQRWIGVFCILLGVASISRT